MGKTLGLGPKGDKHEIHVVLARHRKGVKAMKTRPTKRKFTIWAVLTGFVLTLILLPNASGLENSPLIEPAPDETVVAGAYALISGAIFSSDLALVSAASRQVELARTATGAKKVAKSILTDEYGFSEKQYECLNQLWTQESHWNYKARNRKSGAHGIAQALPASKMDVVGTDWRTNPVTQIRWGIRYISIRYETPCKAWAKHKRSNWY